MYSYQVEIHTQLTGITEQARDILTHIASLGEKSHQIQERRPASGNNEQSNQPNETEECEGELNEILDSSSKTSEADGSLSAGNNSCKVEKSELSKDLLSAEKEQEYKEILEDVVKNVQSSLGMFIPVS